MAISLVIIYSLWERTNVYFLAICAYGSNLLLLFFNHSRKEKRKIDRRRIAVVIVTVVVVVGACMCVCVCGFFPNFNKMVPVRPNCRNFFRISSFHENDKQKSVKKCFWCVASTKVLWFTNSRVKQKENIFIPSLVVRRRIERWNFFSSLTWVRWKMVWEKKCRWECHTQPKNWINFAVKNGSVRLWVNVAMPKLPIDAMSRKILPLLAQSLSETTSWNMHENTIFSRLIWILKKTKIYISSRVCVSSGVAYSAAYRSMTSSHTTDAWIM